MKDLNISKVEMDELWVPVEKSCTKNRNRTYALEYKIMNNLHCDWFMFQTVWGLMLLLSQFNCLSPKKMKMNELGCE